MEVLSLEPMLQFFALKFSIRKIHPQSMIAMDFGVWKLVGSASVPAYLSSGKKKKVFILHDSKGIWQSCILNILFCFILFVLKCNH